jgi:hypothetical protein
VVGGFTASNSVTVADPAGYSKTFTYAMIVNGTGFTVLDNTGATVASPQPVVPFIAYTKNGAALDTTYGPLYLGFIGNVALNQYTQRSFASCPQLNKYRKYPFLKSKNGGAFSARPWRSSKLMLER